MKRSVGPLTTSPATKGLTATTGAAEAAIASRMPGTARIGPMLITGLEGPITIASASRSAVEHLRRRLGLGDPLQLDARAPRARRGRRSGTPAGRAARPRSAPWSGPARRTSAAPAPRPRARGRSAPGRRSAARPRRGTGAGRGRRRGRGRRGRTSSARRAASSRSKTVKVSSRMPQPRSSSISPLSQ